MHLYLVQHGLTVPKDEAPNRPLSEQGRRDVGRMAAFLARTRPAIGRVVHSGKTRAAQTALILSEPLGPGRIVETAADGLAPNDPPDVIATAVAGWSDDAMLVGHLPHLGRLAALLVAGDAGAEIGRRLGGAAGTAGRLGGGGLLHHQPERVDHSRYEEAQRQHQVDPEMQRQADGQERRQRRDEDGDDDPYDIHETPLARHPIRIKSHSTAR